MTIQTSLPAINEEPKEVSIPIQCEIFEKTGLINPYSLLNNTRNKCEIIRETRRYQSLFGETIREQAISIPIQRNNTRTGDINPYSAKQYENRRYQSLFSETIRENRFYQSLFSAK